MSTDASFELISEADIRNSFEIDSVNGSVSMLAISTVSISRRRFSLRWFVSLSDIFQFSLNTGFFAILSEIRFELQDLGHYTFIPPIRFVLLLRGSRGLNFAGICFGPQIASAFLNCDGLQGGYLQ